MALTERMIERSKIWEEWEKLRTQPAIFDLPVVVWQGSTETDIIVGLCDVWLTSVLLLWNINLDYSHTLLDKCGNNMAAILKVVTFILDYAKKAVFWRWETHFAVAKIFFFLHPQWLFKCQYMFTIFESWWDTQFEFKRKTEQLHKVSWFSRLQTVLNWFSVDVCRTKIPWQKQSSEFARFRLTLHIYRHTAHIQYIYKLSTYSTFPCTHSV